MKTILILSIFVISSLYLSSQNMIITSKDDSSDTLNISDIASLSFIEKSEKDMLSIRKLSGVQVEYELDNIRNIIFEETGNEYSLIVHLSANPADTVNLAGIGEISFNPATGVEDNQAIEDDKRIIVYPNPVEGQLTIRIEGHGDITELGIYDLQGRLVKSLSNDIGLTVNISHTWDCNNENGDRVEAGWYICRVVYNNQTHIKKILVVK